MLLELAHDTGNNSVFKKLEKCHKNQFYLCSKTWHKPQAVLKIINAKIIKNYLQLAFLDLPHSSPGDTPQIT